jgi:hypothetical protein
VTREGAPRGALTIGSAREDQLNLTDLDGLTSRDLFHLADARRQREQAKAERELAELARRAEERDNWRTVIADRPALGAFPRRDNLEAPTATEWLSEDPSRLAAVVAEMSRFTADEAKVARTSLELAERLGIDENLAVEVVAEGIRQARCSNV